MRERFVEVYVGNLPATATLLDLHALLEVLLVRPDFRMHQGHDRQERGYHFLVVRTDSREAGESLIAELHGRDYSGHLLEAREYHQRAMNEGWLDSERRLNPG